MTNSKTIRVGKTIRWLRDGVIYKGVVLSYWKNAPLLVESDDFGVFYVFERDLYWA